MLKALTVLCWLAPFVLKAQNPDSTIIKQLDSLFLVTKSYTKQRNFEKAFENNTAAEKLALSKLGQESAEYGKCCYAFARLFGMQQNYSEAEKWCLRALSIQENVLGKDQVEYRLSQEALAMIYSAQGKYKNAEPLYLEVKDYRLKTLGQDHFDYAVVLMSIGNMYYSMNQLEKSEQHYLETKDILEKLLGKSHPAYALSINNLAALYMRMSNFEKAEPLYLEAIAIQEKSIGLEHPDYAKSLNNLAILYMNMGNYEKAEPLYLSALSIRQKAFGEEDPEFAQSLNNLALLYQEMGDYNKALPYYLKAMDIRKKTLGFEHPTYAESLNNLANLYMNTGEYAKAEPLYNQCLSIEEKVYGKNHVAYAESLGNLANLYTKMGQYERAEPLNLEAMSISEKMLGKEQVSYSNLLMSTASMYAYLRKYEKAKPLLIETLSIRERLLGKEHFLYFETLGSLAKLMFLLEQYEESDSLFSQVSELHKTLLNNRLLHLSEKELSQYVLLLSDSRDDILSLVQECYKTTYPCSDMAQICFDNSLFLKGFLLNAAIRVGRLAKYNTTASKEFDLLKSYQRRLSTEYSKPIKVREDLAELEQKANDLEKDLARTVAGYGKAVRQVKWQEVQQSLKPGEAAIEFVHYKPYTMNRTDSIMYAALVLRPGTEAPRFVPLFEEKQLSQLLTDQGKSNVDFINHLYSESLYKILWQPLEKELDGVKTLYFSPSGLLHRFNIEAIPLPAAKGTGTLADRFSLVELGSTRQLVIPSEPVSASRNALLFGGIQYDMDSTSIAQANIDLHTRKLATRGELQFSQSDDSTFQNNTWSYLKWTEVEVASLDNILKNNGFQTTVNKGYTATEESFKSIGRDELSPRILHLATHGFFFPDPKTTNHGGKTDGEPVFKLSDHPMIRAGLLLAGANQAWQTGLPLRPDMEDAILTAYEISQMNLSNTELVVLSACETGLGDISGNEGVYGLQRAFKIAGAKYLIMSLWQVPDFQTQQLMSNFYQNWLRDKMSIPDAFRSAQKAMRDKYKDPFFWAGFVLVE